MKKVICTQRDEFTEKCMVARVGVIGYMSYSWKHEICFFIFFVNNTCILLTITLRDMLTYTEVLELSTVAKKWFCRLLDVKPLIRNTMEKVRHIVKFIKKVID